MGKHSKTADETPTLPMPQVTVGELDSWERLWRSQNPDEWLAPLRAGGTRVERRLRRTYRERGLLLAKRVSNRARRLARRLRGAV